jgi:hypothetical protein
VNAPIQHPAVIVAGSARCLWRDLAECPPGLPVIAVNMAGLVLPKVAHLASAHPVAIGLIAQLRALTRQKRRRDTTPPEVHSIKEAPGVTRVWPEVEGGSSAFFAVSVALGLGYGRVILAGVPLDNSERFYDEPGEASTMDFGAIYLDHWVKMLPDLNGRVVSCSGMTKTLLGGL